MESDPDPFEPPRCPWPACRFHTNPIPGFCKHFGSYTTRVSPRPVPRFRCHGCGRTFSRQTFRYDYRQKRPEIDGIILRHLVTGSGLRPIARIEGINRSVMTAKIARISKHCRELHFTLLGQFRSHDATFVFDEMESFEVERATRPVTIPVCVHRRSLFVVDATAEPIRPSGRMTAARRKRIAWFEARFGRRPHRSNEACTAVLKTLANACRNLPSIVLRTDRKSTYGPIARKVLGADRVVHQTHSSKAPRTPRNPLFAVNHMAARLRSYMGRLRRRTWYVSKKRSRLREALYLCICASNLVGKRFNRDPGTTPAMLVGFCDRPWTWDELIGWRRDFASDEAPQPDRPGPAPRKVSNLGPGVAVC